MAEKAEQRIWVREATKRKLRAFKNRLDDSWMPDDRVVDRLLDIAEMGRFNVEYLEQDITIMNIQNQFARQATLLGAVLGHSSGKWSDFGVSRAQKTKVITLFNDDNLTRIRIRLALGALQELINMDGLPLRTVLDDFVNRIKELTVADSRNEENLDEPTETS
jgi:hypothetical protein